MTVLEILAAKVGYLAPTADQINNAIDEISFTILNYCNISAIPDELVYTWANMAADLLRYQFFVSQPFENISSNQDPSNISALAIGDTQITLDATKNTSERAKALRSHSGNLDKIVLNYSAQLNKFRRMVW
ncbi:MAG: hypothetical protein PHE51_09705 [Eubacteriales bacterium]|nr:hypothetical protein [Eubacteriales bacterium]